MNDILVKFGFTENESRIYLGFLENPLTTAAEMARILKMDKSSAYKACENLLKNGYLIPIGGEKGLLYKSVDPESLKELYESKKAELEVNKQGLESFINKLKRNAPKSRDTFFIVEYGLPAHEKRMWESLETKEKFIREMFRNHEHFKDQDHVDFVVRYADERVRRKIHIQQLEGDFAFMKTKFEEIMTQHKKFNKEVRKLPDGFDNHNSIRIWDNTVNIISYQDKKEFIVVTIKDKFVAELMKNMYDFVWNNSGIFRSS